MRKQEKSITINEEDAFNFIVRILREGLKIIPYPNYGYDLYLPNVMQEYLITVQGIELQNTKGKYMEIISPLFYSAAWNLCRRGILRPGVSSWGKQSTDRGSAGDGYSITIFGYEWLKECDEDDYVPSEPERFAKILSNFGPRFGPGFNERAQEAIRCYGAHTYIACCAMCGAATESIILSIAIAKNGDEDKILKIYFSRGGRGRIENLIIGQKEMNIKNEFLGYSSLLKYWRDVASHGKKSNITDNEAYTSLALLLRFAQFANERWDDLIKS